MMTTSERQSQLQMVDLVKKFYRSYQEAVDSRRQTVDKFYADDGHLVYEGNMYNSFPHPNGQIIVVIAACGNVTYDDIPHTYSQSITCVLRDGELKIVTDNYRLLN
ncbi:hypothetical protein FO519_004868 [Halicephalobus sp. NKZ332]|nr:hypothetical protein FO519_004868 [Halicephalobus sp. NKZ332]